MIPSTMTAIAIEGGAGSAEALRPTEISTPTTNHGEILIKVHSAGVNRPDLLQRAGNYPPPPGAPGTLGLEAAGEVVAVGPGVIRWKVGDQVTALLGGGGYAEFAAVDARHALPIPGGLDSVHAGALPEAAFTAYCNIFEHGALRAGESILIHGATSGIGVLAIQMAKAAGAHVIATGRGLGKAAEALKLGADVAVDVNSEDFAAAAIACGGVDVVLDMVAGPYFSKNLQALRTGGRLVHIAFQAGGIVELPIVDLMLKRLVVTGSTLRGRDGDEKARIAQAVEQTVWPWIEQGKVKCVIDCILPLHEAARAHARLEAGGHVGKVVLVPMR